MDVRLSPEQHALRDAARQVVDRLGPRTVGALSDRERTAKLDAAVDATGWRELRTAADRDAPLASGVEVGIVAEELGRGVADAAFVGPTMAAELRRLVGAPAATSAETVALLPDLSGPALSGPDGEALAGRAVAIDSVNARAALVLVPVAGRYTLASVALAGRVDDAAAVVDLTRPAQALAAGLPVTPLPDQARPLTADALTGWTALGLALSAADLVGTMAGAVELARAYAAERQQYGVAVGSFQAVQHLLADAFVATEGSRSAALHAAWAVDALDPDEALAAAAAAKAYATRAARDACETAIQVHGGIGNTWECLAHVHLRRALVSTEIAGGEGPNLDRVLTHLGLGAGA